MKTFQNYMSAHVERGFSVMGGIKKLHDKWNDDDEGIA